MAKYRAKQAQEYMLEQKRKNALLKHKTSKNLIVEKRSSYVDATPRLLNRLGLQSASSTNILNHYNGFENDDDDDDNNNNNNSEMLNNTNKKTITISNTARMQLHKAKSQHMINTATANLLLNQANMPSSTMINDPYYRDKPEMVDILLHNSINNNNNNSNDSNRHEKIKENTEALERYLKAQGGGLQLPPPPPPPPPPPMMDNNNNNSPKKSILELTTSFQDDDESDDDGYNNNNNNYRSNIVDESELDPYDKYLLKKKKQQLAAESLLQNGNNTGKVSYAQKHRVNNINTFAYNSNNIQKRTKSITIRRNTIIAPETQIDMLKKSRTLYAKRSLDWTKDKVNKKQQQEAFNKYIKYEDIIATHQQLNNNNNHNDEDVNNYKNDFENEIDLTWVNDVDIDDDDDDDDNNNTSNNKEQTSEQRQASIVKNRSNRSSSKTSSFTGRDEKRLNEINESIRESSSNRTLNGNAKHRKRDSYLEIRKNTFKQQRDLDAMENDTTGKNIGKTAPSWILKETDVSISRF